MEIIHKNQEHLEGLFEHHKFMPRVSYVIRSMPSGEFEIEYGKPRDYSEDGHGDLAPRGPMDPNIWHAGSLTVVDKKVKGIEVLHQLNSIKFERRKNVPLSFANMVEAALKSQAKKRKVKVMRR